MGSSHKPIWYMHLQQNDWGLTNYYIIFVGDLKLSHVDKEVVKNKIKKRSINAKSKTKTQELNVTKGDIHNYLGLTLDYSYDSYVKITMYDFLQDMLQEVKNWPGFEGTAQPLPLTDLFSVDEDSLKLTTIMLDKFHQLVARLLLSIKRARLDTLVTVVYLCTRVKSPIVSDYFKLAWLIKYIRGAIQLLLLLGWDEFRVMTWLINADFDVHNDIQLHTGACLTTGKGSLINISMKQKINNESSIEANLVGVDDAMNFLIWSKLYFKWQMKDYPDDESRVKLLEKTNIIQQDITSTIQFEQHDKNLLLREHNI